MVSGKVASRILPSILQILVHGPYLALTELVKLKFLRKRGIEGKTVY
jgi:hypothetical protein